MKHALDRLHSTDLTRRICQTIGLALCVCLTVSCVQEQSPRAVAAKPDKAKQEKTTKKKPGPGSSMLDEESVDLVHPESKKEPVIEEIEPSFAPADERPAFVAEAESRLTKRYRERLLEIEEQHAELKRKDAEITGGTKLMMAKLENLTALEDRLQQELGIGKARREYRDQRTTALASLMMTMPPQSGARILSNMSEQDAQDIVLAVAQKNERKAAKILAQMPPERVASLSQRYLSSQRKLKDVGGLLPPTTSTTPNAK